MGFLDKIGLTYLWSKISSTFARKTEIPSSLPANGGNADTVDNMHIRKGTSGADGYITFVV